MPTQSVAELVPILQIAIAPALLISSVGLLLLTMVNRLNHVADRARALAARAGNHPEGVATRTPAQLAILWQRARLIRYAIVFASASALSSALLIVTLFLSALLRFEDAWLIGVFFIIAMSALVFSLLFFMADINRSLAALKLELDKPAGDGQD